MNGSPSSSDSFLDTLFARARAERPDTTRAEYAFETRLLARLQSARQSDRVWARVSWRMVPFFGAFVLVLVLWQAEVSSTAQDAEQAALAENSAAVDLWNNFN